MAQTALLIDALKIEGTIDLAKVGNDLQLTVSGGDFDINSVNFKNMGTLNTHTIPVGTGTLALTSQVMLLDGTQAMGASMAMGSNKITGLATPTVGTDAVTKDYVDSAAQGLDWQESVLDTQVDATLDPGAAPTTGDRYILEDTANLHANFGAPAGVANDDIVEYTGTVFEVVWDASATEAEGGAAWDEDENLLKVFNGTAWVKFGSTVNHNNALGLQGGAASEYYHTNQAEYNLLTSTGGVSDAGAMHNHAGEISTHAGDANAHHTESHTVASHSDTTATGAELETLTDGSDAGALHMHNAAYYTETEVDDILVGGKSTSGTSIVSLDITHGATMAGTDYGIGISLDQNVNWWLTSVTTTQFTVNFSATVSSISVYWTAAEKVASR